jgi:hypothetical protein
MSIIEVKEFLRREESSYLTIADIVKMKPGETIEVLCIDRNFSDWHVENYTPMGAKEFFKDNYVWLIAKSGDGLDVKWKQSENGSDCGFEEYEEREFDLNYREGYWYPLLDGKLLGRFLNHRLTEDGESKHWSSYPETTMVGWRGPMLPYRCVAECEEKLYCDKRDAIECEADENEGWLSEIRKRRKKVSSMCKAGARKKRSRGERSLGNPAKKHKRVENGDGEEEPGMDVLDSDNVLMIC